MRPREAKSSPKAAQLGEGLCWDLDTGPCDLRVCGTRGKSQGRSKTDVQAGISAPAWPMCPGSPLTGTEDRVQPPQQEHPAPGECHRHVKRSLLGYAASCELGLRLTGLGVGVTAWSHGPPSSSEEGKVEGGHLC